MEVPAITSELPNCTFSRVPTYLEQFGQFETNSLAVATARLALISQSQRAEAEKIVQQDGYIELALVPNFNRKFAEATYL